MAKMHSRAKGQSGSKKPLVLKVPSWVRYKAKEVEMLAVKLAKEDHAPSVVGAMLRDSYGIPSVKAITGKTIKQLLKEKKVNKELPEDLQSLLKRAVTIKKHMEKNKKDMTAVRGLRLTESKILRLAKYYKRTGEIPATWQYKPEEIKMMAE
ncbi:30S ribosomal protein S15 [Candidatus Woesearchaeota archaeon]|nr:30S ribosomal protein S15 [Candidatus Woesearchaeota archaeon]